MPIAMNRKTEDWGLRTGKGQLFSGDIAVATMIFIAALALAIFLWNSSTEDINKAEKLRDLQKLAASTTEQLIRTPGIPPTWDTNWDVKVPGLATNDRVINFTKADAFIDMMNATWYDEYRHTMGLGEYGFYMEVSDLNGSVVDVNGKPFIAGKPLSDYDESVSVLRTAIYNGTIVRVNFIIWK